MKDAKSKIINKRGIKRHTKEKKNEQYENYGRGEIYTLIMLTYCFNNINRHYYLFK